MNSLLILLDDIAAIMDDVAIMTKMAAKKTAGVVGDDLALNANAISEGKTPAERELPIIWAVAKGSLINKIILIPIAMLLSIFLPMLIQPLLMIGGAYLCFEGVEKVIHKYFHHPEKGVNTEIKEVSENDKIKGAIRTDFILSAEIIIIALSVSSLSKQTGVITQLITLSLIGVGMTILVYGLVALIVKADDFGLYLQKKSNVAKQKLGLFIISVMPYLMKALAIIGTIAMFLVGGGIFTHQKWFHEWQEQTLGHLNTLSSVALDGVVGIIVGVICVMIFMFCLKIKNMVKK